MPAKSKKQQRFMGMVHAAQQGEGAASPEVAAAAQSMKPQAALDFASTPQKGLPERVTPSAPTQSRTAVPSQPATPAPKKPGPKWGTTGKISGDIKKKAF